MGFCIRREEHGGQEHTLAVATRRLTHHKCTYMTQNGWSSTSLLFRNQHTATTTTNNEQTRRAAAGVITFGVVTFGVVTLAGALSASLPSVFFHPCAPSTAPPLGPECAVSFLEVRTSSRYLEGVSANSFFSFLSFFSPSSFLGAASADIRATPPAPPSPLVSIRLPLPASSLVASPSFEGIASSEDGFGALLLRLRGEGNAAFVCPASLYHLVASDTGADDFRL